MGIHLLAVKGVGAVMGMVVDMGMDIDMGMAVGVVSLLWCKKVCSVLDIC
jgi:hypothetical protein